MMLCYIILCYIILYYIIYTMLYYIMLCYIILYDIDIILYYIIYYIIYIWFNNRRTKFSTEVHGIKELCSYCLGWGHQILLILIVIVSIIVTMLISIMEFIGMHINCVKKNKQWNHFVLSVLWISGTSSKETSTSKSVSMQTNHKRTKSNKMTTNEKKKKTLQPNPYVWEFVWMTDCSIHCEDHFVKDRA